MTSAAPNYQATPIEAKTIPELKQYLSGMDLNQRHITNEDMAADIDTRALWAADTLLRYAERVGDDHEIDSAQVDLLTDLQHLTTALGADFQTILDRATMHYEAEEAGER
ncbi:hypothetical protein IU468_28395 [Nocardia farcinica]|uniref:hypothetical protein n=1 Tax=Nocardia farcinica TaxID=37329 RepID=UPI0018946BF8|nr:hypothetical protein [Nocardia farcinica]MBF6260186.1 hypothetical protein [Nocardia farcinica]